MGFLLIELAEVVEFMLNLFHLRVNLGQQKFLDQCCISNMAETELQRIWLSGVWWWIARLVQEVNSSGFRNWFLSAFISDYESSFWSLEADCYKTIKYSLKLEIQPNVAYKKCYKIINFYIFTPLKYIAWNSYFSDLKDKMRFGINNKGAVTKM